jgi:hypothetical protein
VQSGRSVAAARQSEAGVVTGRHAKTFALVWGSEPPAFSIGHDEPMGAADSGFSVLFDDAPAPDEVEGPDDPRISLVCLDCLIDDHPELGRGLDRPRVRRR